MKKSLLLFLLAAGTVALACSHAPQPDTLQASAYVTR